MNNRNIKYTKGEGIICHNLYDKVISLDNLFKSWNEFKRGKESKPDVQEFAFCLEDNIFELHHQLEDYSYKHSDYTSFYISDPKLRHIHKASVRDRVLHHAIMRVIEPLFDKSFIFDSYSSRKNKGAHKAVKRLNAFAWRLYRNNTKTVWTLKCDIKKFFASVDQVILIDLIKKKIQDNRLNRLLDNIIMSFNIVKGKGIPLGNLTSQLFSNIYLNELDQFVKRKLRVKYYLRYADDFVLLDRNKEKLKKLLLAIDGFLNSKLELQLHLNKILLNKWHQGIDFLGYVSFPHHIILRTKTKRRMFKKISNRFMLHKQNKITADKFNQTLQSYYGVLSHCYSNKIKQQLDYLIS